MENTVRKLEESLARVTITGKKKCMCCKFLDLKYGS